MIRAIGLDDFCTRSYRQGRSQFHFASLHSDLEIRKYCEIDASLAAWRERWRDYAAILRRTRELDRLANIRLEAGFTLPIAFQERLDAAYRHAFFLSRAKGVADASSLAPAKAPDRLCGGRACYGLPGDLSILARPVATAGIQGPQDEAAGMDTYNSYFYEKQAVASMTSGTMGMKNDHA
jgi:hypothetical protein